MGPLKIGLSNPKRICSRPNATEVNIDPQNSNVIMQLRRPRRAQKLVACVSEQPDIVGSFFAPDRKIENQVLGRSSNPQRRLISANLALPASYGSLTKIQDGRVSRSHRVSASHPQPSSHREEQNSSSGDPSQHPSALDRRLRYETL